MNNESMIVLKIISLILVIIINILGLGLIGILFLSAPSLESEWTAYERLMRVSIYMLSISLVVAGISWFTLRSFRNAFNLTRKQLQKIFWGELILLLTVSLFTALILFV